MRKRVCTRKSIELFDFRIDEFFIFLFQMHRLGSMQQIRDDRLKSIRKPFTLRKIEYVNKIENVAQKCNLLIIYVPSMLLIIMKSQLNNSDLWLVLLIKKKNGYR